MANLDAAPRRTWATKLDAVPARVPFLALALAVCAIVAAFL